MCSRGLIPPSLGAGGFEQATGPNLSVAGTLNPDATGTYVGTGTWDYKPYYTIGSNYFIWWDMIGSGWIISVLLGTKGSAYWSAVQPEVNGVYSPLGTATGDATVTKLP